MPKKKVVVLGWYGHGNCGDESYKLSFPLIFPEYDFIFTDDIKPSMRNADAYVMGGGDIVYSHLLEKIKKVKGKKHLISVSLTSADDLDNITGIFDTVSVRDFRSHNKLKTMGINGQYMPDNAFALCGNEESGRIHIQRLFAERRHDLYSKVVLVVFNAHLIVKRDGLLARDETTFLKFANDFAGIADCTPASFVFVPFGFNSPHDDRIPNSWIASKCKFWQKNMVIYDYLTPQETLDMFAAADAAVCTRLHSGIFSIVGQTPFIDITHHDKTRSFMEAHRLEHWMFDYWHFEKKKAAELLNEHLDNPKAKSIVTNLAKTNKELLKQLGKTKLI